MISFYRVTLIFFFSFFLLIKGFASNFDNFYSIEKYKDAPISMLLKCADKFLDNNVNDSAFIYYSIVCNKNIKNDDSLAQQIKCKALNRISLICYDNCEYELSFEYLLKALALCEKIHYIKYIASIYNNIGNVYNQFRDYKNSKKYYELAYKNTTDSLILGRILNNFGTIAYQENRLEDALSFYKQTNRIKSRSKDSSYYLTLHNIGLVHKAMYNYDSAFFYFHTALNLLKSNFNQIETGRILSNIGQLYFILKNNDSAIFYLEKSNKIAQQLKSFNVLSDNYMALSKIEGAMGNISKSFNYYKKSSLIRDSLFGVNKYATINKLEFMYDMGKVDKQIKELSMEQEVKERTISMQRKFEFIIIVAFLTVSGFLIMLYQKKKNLNKAYTALVSKNIEIVNSDKINKELKIEYEEKLKNFQITDDFEGFMKYKGSNLKNNVQNDLMLSILDVMENRDLICDPDFSLNQLAEMVGSNYNYVSQTINESFKKNFRSFLNDYRIKEARRILSDPNYKKYSIQSISIMVGFKSRSTFDITFKDVTGVTPSFYIKSLNSSSI